MNDNPYLSEHGKQVQKESQIEQAGKCQHCNSWLALNPCCNVRDDLEQQLAASQQRCETFRLALESLTPQGSEYHNDPERCVQYVKEHKANLWEQIKRSQQRFNEMRDSFDRCFQDASELTVERDSLKQRVKELEDRIERINKTNTPYAHYALELEIELKKAFAERDSLKREVEEQRKKLILVESNYGYAMERCAKLEEALRGIQQLAESWQSGTLNVDWWFKRITKRANAALNEGKEK